jgi:glycosyltransferase involved in cell wall biosynthesis
MKISISISVVIPSLNSGSFLSEALESAINQVPPPHEVIVQDGGSTDGTIEILNRTGPPVAWRSEPDNGQSDALNRAIARATGDVLVWVNADDRLLPGSFAAAVGAFEEHPQADFVYGDFEMVRSDGAIIRRFRSSAYDPARVFTHGCYIFSGAMFYRREFMNRIGPYDESLHACMDLDYLLRLGNARAVHLNQAVAQFRWSEGAKSSRMRRHFLRESHRLRWRAAHGSIKMRALTLALDARDAITLWTQPLRFTSAWSAIRGNRTL